MTNTVLRWIGIALAAAICLSAFVNLVVGNTLWGVAWTALALGINANLPAVPKETDRA